jgi:hypothetical protein
MRINLLVGISSAVAAVAVAGSASASVTWTQDRYAPQVFNTVGNDITLGLRSAGSAANRPSAFSSTFYNYQGMATSSGFSGAERGSSVSIEMRVDAAWNNGARAGFWTTMSNGNLTYPIIEYVKGTSTAGAVGESGFTGFRWWQSGLGWTQINASVGTNAWYRMTIGLGQTNVTFDITDVFSGTSIFSSTVGNQGALKIDNVILNAHNQGIAGEYDVQYRNFVVNAVPAPGAAALLGAAGLVGARRRKA